MRSALLLNTSLWQFLRLLSELIRQRSGWQILWGLVLALVLGVSQPAAAQFNPKFVTNDDSNQVPAGTVKQGNVIPNDINVDNLPNSAFVVTLVSGPVNGGSVTLNADGSYVYTPSPGQTSGADSFTYQICQPGATPSCSNVSTVRLNIYEPSAVCTLGTGPNLIRNPSFTEGNAEFTSSYNFVAVPTGGIGGGNYAVDTDATPYYNRWVGKGRTGQPGDKFMIVDGAPNLSAVYAQTVRVQPNRYYSFSVYAANIHPPDLSAPQLALVVDGKSTSAVVTLSGPTGQYEQIKDLYFSGPGPAGGFDITVEVRDVNKDFAGNDFGLDDLYFGSCSTFLTADTKTTTLVPNVPVATPILPLSATITVGGSAGVTVASFTVQSLPATGTITYNGVPVTVGQVIPVGTPGGLSSGGRLTYTPAGGCTASSPTFTYTATDSDGNGSSNIATYTIPVGPVPPPTVRAQGENPFCVGTSVELRTRPRLGYLFTWYNGSTIVNGAGGVLNDSVFVALNPGNYTVKTELAGCAATSGPLSVTTKACAPPEPCSLDEKFINTWYFGDKAGLNFNAQAPPAETPAILTDGQMTAPEGTCSMSDENGNLIFYTNGVQVWNRNHVLMPNGSGLAGNLSSTDGPMAIRLPGSKTRYYLFTQDSEGKAGGLSYSEIDMTLNGGLGDVLLGTKNTPLVKRTTEKMTAVLHANGCDSWVIVHGWGDPAVGDEPGWPAAEHRGDAFLAFRVTPAGVVPTPVVSQVGPLHAPSVAPLAFNGQMKASPDGRQLAVARFNDGPVPENGTVELYAFDAATGTVSDPRTIDSGGGQYYGVEFSPGLNNLYATILSPPQLLQFDLSDRDNVPASKKVIATSPVGLGSIQAAPDGKIYVARQNQPELGVITYPDSLDVAADYVDKGQALGGRLSGLGLPNFNQSFLVKVGFSAVSTACLVIKFQAGTNIPDPETYTWNFGDPASGPNNVSTIAEPSHIFPAPGEYTITLRITKSCLCKEIKATIIVPGSPTAGGIGADQTVCAGAVPAPLTSTAPAGAGTGEYAYQWESSSDRNTWTAIGGATGASYTPGVLAGTTYFRRKVSSGFCDPAFTDAVTITVLPALVPGSVADNQTICAGSAPQPLTSRTPAAGGTGTFTYQWESSPDGATWTDIAGATGADYAPGPLTATTRFRRRVNTTICGTDPSNEVLITVVPALVAGGIADDQTLCAGGTPQPLTSTAPASGGTGTYAYQWESSIDNTTWVDVAGATSEVFTPGQLARTTYFRRRVSASAGSCPPLASNVVTITVRPALTAGGIGADQVVCPGATPVALSSVSGPGGGTGAFTYQWESSADNTTWADIAGATGADYAPGPLTATTYFRRRVTSAPCDPAYSAVVTIQVLPPLTAGRIGADQDQCAGVVPVPLGSAASATGGTGSYAYQWESSTNNVTWTAIAGATDAGYAPGALTATTYFRRRVTSGTGECATAFSEPVVVRVQPLAPTAVTLAPPPVLCPGTPLTFNAVATDAGGAPTYRWFVNNAAVASGPTFTSSTLVTGDQVRVTVTPTAGLCSTGPASATVTVNRVPTEPPTVTIQVEPGVPVCPGDLLTFSVARATNAGPAPQYQWQVNGADVPGAQGPTFSSTTFSNGQTVTLRLLTTNSCGAPLPAISNGVGVVIGPPVNVDAGPDKEVLEGESVQLEGSADGNYPVVWTPTEGLTFPSGDRLRPRAAPTVTTVYRLSAGTGNCADADEVRVVVRPRIRIPNAFTPNGDGRDDTWQIEHIEEFPDNTVNVFNRWGNQIFSANNYSRANEWRGDINGQPAPIGTYYYVVVTKGPTGRSYSGSITILY
jgi:gliding motility-associated-like protein